jgi:hypothetical protein
MARPAGLEPATTGLEGGGPLTQVASYRVTRQPFKVRLSSALSNWLARTPYTNTRWVHDPEPMFDPFPGQHWQDSGHQAKYLSAGGLVRPKHHDACVIARRIPPDVRKIESRVKSTRASTWHAAATLASSAPASPSSWTVSHFQPAARRSSAASTGRFSSSFARIRGSYAGRGRVRSCARSAAYASAA